MLYTAAGSLFSLLIGALGEVLDYRLCMSICGIFTLVMCWLTVFYSRRHVKKVFSPSSSLDGQ